MGYEMPRLALCLPLPPAMRRMRSHGGTLSSSCRLHPSGQVSHWGQSRPNWKWKRHIGAKRHRETTTKKKGITDATSQQVQHPCLSFSFVFLFYLFFCPCHTAGLRPRGYAPSKGSDREECGHGRNGSGTPSVLIISFMFLFDLVLKFHYHFY